jgi:hypothetical protein
MAKKKSTEAYIENQQHFSRMKQLTTEDTDFADKYLPAS